MPIRVRRWHRGQPAPGPAQLLSSCFFFQAEDGIRDVAVTGVQTCALPILFPWTQFGCLRWRLPGIPLLMAAFLLAPICIIDAQDTAKPPAGTPAEPAAKPKLKIGRASCRERVEMQEDGGGLETKSGEED